MKVGDYARTASGDIGIIINCPEQLKKDYGNWLWLETINEQRPIRNEDVIKSSPKPIGLIEVGDYVNGCYVDEIIDANDSWDDRQHFHLLKFNSYFGNSDIKSIVAKEQFESMEYKVGE